MTELCTVWWMTRHCYVQSQCDTTQYTSRKERNHHGGEGGGRRSSFAVRHRSESKTTQSEQARTRCSCKRHMCGPKVVRGARSSDIFLNGGNRRTFVGFDIAERLQLSVLGEEELRIFTFDGNATANQVMCRQVELWLEVGLTGEKSGWRLLKCPASALTL